MKRHLGELLVEAGIISLKTLERALIRQQGSGKRLGSVLEEMGVIDQEELVDALASQFGFATIRGTASQSIPESLLKLIPQELAMQKLVFPLKRDNGKLSLAVTDPFDRDTLDLIEEKTSLTIVPVLATRNDILDAVRRHYLCDDTAGNCTLKVLLVDDSQVVTSVVGDALRGEGYEVLTANDGVDGLRIAFSQKPDLILCDAVMPKLDGYGLMRAIKANPATSEIPMILLTAKGSPEEEHRALKSGFHDFIAKPMMTVRVVSRVKRAFEILNQVRVQPSASAASG